MGSSKRNYRWSLLVAPLGCLALLASATTASAEKYRLDHSFGGAGTARIDIQIDSEFSGPVEMALEPDGHILVVGNTRASGVGKCEERPVLARFLPEGQIDTEFGTNGSVTISLPGPGPDSSQYCGGYATGVAVAPDGSIFVGGWMLSGSCVELCGSSFVIKRHADGSADTSFDGDGVAWLNADSFSCSTGVEPHCEPLGPYNYQDKEGYYGRFQPVRATDIAVMPNGEPVLVGGATFERSWDLPEISERWGFVWRPVAGVTVPIYPERTSPAYPFDVEVTNIAFAPGGLGSLLVTYATESTQTYSFRVATYDPQSSAITQGAEDSTPVGEFATSPHTNNNGNANDLAVQPDGKTLAMVEDFPGLTTVARYTAGSAPVRDPAFAGGSFYRTKNSAFRLHLLALQGTRVLMGSGWLGRLTADGVPDPSFSSGELPDDMGFRSPTEVDALGTDMAVDSAERILTMGVGTATPTLQTWEVKRLTSAPHAEGLPFVCHSYSVPRESMLTVPDSSGLLSGADSLQPPATRVHLTRISFDQGKLDLSPTGGGFTFLATANISQLATIDYELLDGGGQPTATGKAYIHIDSPAGPDEGCVSENAAHQTFGALKKKAKKTAKKAAKRSAKKDKKVKKAKKKARRLQNKYHPPGLDQELYACSSDGTKCYWMYSNRVVTGLARATQYFQIKNYCLQFDIERLIKCDKVGAVITLWNDIDVKRALDTAANTGACYGGKTTYHTGLLGFFGETIEQGQLQSIVNRNNVFVWPMYKAHGGGGKLTGLRCDSNGKVVRYSSYRTY